MGLWIATAVVAAIDGELLFRRRDGGGLVARLEERFHSEDQRELAAA